MKEKFMRFMQGRYGVDQLSKALLVIGLISVLLASFFRGSLIGTFFYYVGWFLIIYCYFRMFSKNVSKRYAENQAYLAKSYKIRCFFAKQKDLFRQRKGSFSPESSIIFINVRDAVRRSGFQEAKERSRSVVRSVAQSS